MNIIAGLLAGSDGTPAVPTGTLRSTPEGLRFTEKRMRGMEFVTVTHVDIPWAMVASASFDTDEVIRRGSYAGAGWASALGGAELGLAYAAGEHEYVTIRDCPLEVVPPTGAGIGSRRPPRTSSPFPRPPTGTRGGT